MKFAHNCVRGIFLVCFLLPLLSESKLIQSMNRFSARTKNSSKKIRQAEHPIVERRLEGEGDGPQGAELKKRKITGGEFKLAIYHLLRNELGKQLDHDKMDLSIQDTIRLEKKSQLVCQAILTLEDGDDFHEEFVEITLENNIVKMELSIEKTSWKHYVAEYLMFYVNKGVFMMRQTVNVMDDISGDYKSVMGFVLDRFGGDHTFLVDNYKGGGGSNTDEERRLQDVKLTSDLLKEKMDRRLKQPPVLGKFMMKNIDLKKARVTSQKKGVAEFIRSLKPLFEKDHEYKDVPYKISPRELFEADMSRPSLRPTDPNFFVGKATSYKKHQFLHPILRDIMKLAVDINNPRQDTPELLEYNLFTGRRDLPDCRKSLIFVNSLNPVEIKYRSSVIEYTINVSVPSKRFVLKHSRIGDEIFAGTLSIVSHLTDLQVWRDSNLSPPVSYGEMIYETVSRKILQLMFREIFDNLTDGQTAMPGDGGSNVLRIGPSVDPERPANIFYITKGADNDRSLGVALLVGDIGEEFEVTLMTAGIYYETGEYLMMGFRMVPNKSMYNQHFLLKRFMDMLVELTVRRDPFYIDYKDNITPFITDAFGYPDGDMVPRLEIADDGEIDKCKHSTDVISANKLEPKNFGDRIYYKLCPTESVEFHDTIKNVDGDYVFAGARFFLRKDFDYCYWITNNMPKGSQKDDEEGQEERRLLEDNVSGHLV